MDALIKSAKIISPNSVFHLQTKDILIEKGFSDLQSLIIILILTLVIAIVGIVGELLMVSEWKMFYSFIALFVTYSLYTFYSWKKVKP